MKVIVEIPEVYYSTHELEVSDGATDEEIRDIVLENAAEADELALKYGYALDLEEWTIRKENGDLIGF